MGGRNGGRGCYLLAEEHEADVLLINNLLKHLRNEQRLNLLIQALWGYDMNCAVRADRERFLNHISSP